MKSKISDYNREVAGHLRDILAREEEFIAGLTTTDSIIHATQLAVTTHRFIEIHPGFIDTTSDSISLEKISDVEYERTSDEFLLQIHLNAGLKTYALQTEPTEFCEQFMNASKQAETRRNHLQSEPDSRSELRTVLSEAERLFMTGLAAHFQGKRTVCRLRYQQAHSKYRDAQELLSGLEQLDSPISIEDPASNATTPHDLEKNQLVTDALYDALAEHDITTIGDLHPRMDDLDSANLSTDSRNRIELLHLWSDESPAEFENSDDIASRIQHCELASEIV